MRKVQHKGVRVKIISEQELGDYLETLYYLVDYALTKCEPKWTAVSQEELLVRFRVIEEKRTNESVYEYVLAVANLLELFFEIAGNIAMRRFFKETTFVTNVAAQTNWKKESIEFYHQSIIQAVESMKTMDFENVRKALKDVILWLSIN